MNHVGLDQYIRVFEAARYYCDRGYLFLTVPWAVSAEALCITKPETVSLSSCPHYPAGGEELYVVASAEQSFLHQQLKYIRKWNSPDIERYVAVTPCFRNEPVLDDLHQPYFLKDRAY
jgi:seryl-tRNA synthetase